VVINLRRALARNRMTDPGDTNDLIAYPGVDRARISSL
jgi:hypothetical protein